MIIKTPYELELDKKGKIELYTNKRSNRFVTKEEVTKNQALRLMIICKWLQEGTGTTKEKISQLKRAHTLVHTLDIWSQFASYLVFIRTAALINPTLAQTVVDDLGAAYIKTKFIKEIRDADGSLTYGSARWSPQSRVWNLVRLAVLAKVCKLNSKTFGEKISSILKKDTAKQVYDVITFSLGLYDAGIPHRPMMEWGIELLNQMSKDDKTLYALNLAKLCIYIGDEEMSDTFFAMADKKSQKDIRERWNMYQTERHIDLAKAKKYDANDSHQWRHRYKDEFKKTQNWDILFNN